ncbi:MAG: ComF family protein [Ruminococcaceae bacterium]|nr:ComF family protein [Oscillospiraceae bacterium]
MIPVLLDLLFPPKCPFCRKLLEDGQALLCPDCQRNLPWAQGKPAERKLEFVDLCTAPLWYQDEVRQSHHRYKFSGVRAYARPYATLMAQCVADRLQGQFDVISWVPLSRKRLRSRGYDQSRLLAERLAQQLDMPCKPMLKKIRDTKAQSGLKGESERRANVLGAYVPLPSLQMRGERVLLVDDVVTTGATLSECARILRGAGAERVVCVTLAMAGVDGKT